MFFDNHTDFYSGKDFRTLKQGSLFRASRNFYKFCYNDKSNKKIKFFAYTIYEIQTLDLENKFILLCAAQKYRTELIYKLFINNKFYYIDEKDLYLSYPFYIRLF